MRALRDSNPRQSVLSRQFVAENQTRIEAMLRYESSRGVRAGA
jgi:hypothetical protein